MSRISFEQVVADVASVAEVPSDSISRDSRLIADLGLDSLGMHELLVVLREHGLVIPMQLAGGGTWQHATVADLLDAGVERRET